MEPKDKLSRVISDEDRACACDDGDGSVKPVISSPVSHLWTSEDGVTPLIRPEEATSTGVLHVHKDCLMPGLCLNYSYAKPEISVQRKM